MTHTEKLQAAMLVKEAGMLGGLGRLGGKAVSGIGSLLGKIGIPTANKGLSAGSDRLMNFGNKMIGGANKMQGYGSNIAKSDEAARALGKQIAGYGGTALGAGALGGGLGHSSGLETGRYQGIDKGLQLGHAAVGSTYGGLGGRLKALLGGAQPGQNTIEELMRQIQEMR